MVNSAAKNRQSSIPTHKVKTSYICHCRLTLPSYTFLSAHLGKQHQEILSNNTKFQLHLTPETQDYIVMLGHQENAQKNKINKKLVQKKHFDECKKIELAPVYQSNDIKAINHIQEEKQSEIIRNKGRQIFICEKINLTQDQRQRKLNINQTITPLFQQPLINDKVDNIKNGSNFKDKTKFKQQFLKASLKSYQAEFGLKKLSILPNSSKLSRSIVKYINTFYKTDIKGAAIMRVRQIIALFSFLIKCEQLYCNIHSIDEIQENQMCNFLNYFVTNYLPNSLKFVQIYNQLKTLSVLNMFLRGRYLRQLQIWQKWCFKNNFNINEIELNVLSSNFIIATKLWN